MRARAGVRQALWLWLSLWLQIVGAGGRGARRQRVKQGHESRLRRRLMVIEKLNVTGKRQLLHHVIAAAVAARAELIDTGDRKHLLPFGNHQGVAIVTAREAVERLEPRGEA